MNLTLIFKNIISPTSIQELGLRKYIFITIKYCENSVKVFANTRAKKDSLYIFVVLAQSK